MKKLFCVKGQVTEQQILTVPLDLICKTGTYCFIPYHLEKLGKDELQNVFSSYLTAEF
jgi:hypothetical protein